MQKSVPSVVRERGAPVEVQFRHNELQEGSGRVLGHDAWNCHGLSACAHWHVEQRLIVVYDDYRSGVRSAICLPEHVSEVLPKVC